jgi:excisionase family DNA binding protein
MDYLERLLTPRQVAELEGCGLTTVYKRLTDGEYTAVKDGVKTLISSASVARRRESLPQAQYNVRRGIFGIPSKADAASNVTADTSKRPRGRPRRITAQQQTEVAVP